MFATTAAHSCCINSFIVAMQGMDTLPLALQYLGSFSVTLVEISGFNILPCSLSNVYPCLYGWPKNRLQNLFMAVAFGFVCFSILVAQSDSLIEVVFFRFFQGACGAGFNPLTIQIILAAFPRSLHGIAFGWLQMGRNSSIVIGPIVGGLLTELFDWRFIYLINVPLGLLGSFLIWRLL